LVDLLVLGLVLWFHVPFEAVLETLILRIIFDLLELLLLARERLVGLHEMCLGFGNQPVGNGRRDVLIFLDKRKPCA
jgi:hypothetical protein